MDYFLFDRPSAFDLSNYVLLDEGPVECPLPALTEPLRKEVLFSPVASYAVSTSRKQVSEFESGATGKQSVEGRLNVAFRTKSDIDIMDDGFKWRKYGKKSIKNSPNPRNYYRCSTEGCSVKKRVERDPKEPCYVITTYDGIHNHSSTDVVYYTTQDIESGRFVVSGCHQFPRSS